MILLENKADTAKATLSQLLLGTKKGDGNAFGKMLMELTGEEGQEGRALKNGLPVILGLEEGDAKKPLGKSLVQLLHGDKEASDLSSDEQHDLALLHPKLTRGLPQQDLRALVHNAREHLKEQIRQFSDVTEMPKTLKGLIQLAQKVGIDLEKISFEQMPGQKAVAVLQEMESPRPSAVKTDVPAEHMTAQLVQNKQQRKPKEAESKQELLRDLLQNDAKTSSKQIPATDKGLPAIALASEAVRDETNAAHGRQPMFASAINQLLHGSDQEASVQDSSAVETEPGKAKSAEPVAAAAKADPLKLKINEAKEMVRHFAADIKEAVENYKPPFTRLKIQLNPGKLGEVDVTMVQRGNNVHINISSNPAAINTLSQNATELKTQLAQNGLANATMNFNSGSNQQQQQEQQRNASALYEQLEQIDDFDLLEQLEIVVPRYV